MFFILSRRISSPSMQSLATGTIQPPGRAPCATTRRGRENRPVRYLLHADYQHSAATFLERRHGIDCIRITRIAIADIDHGANSQPFGFKSQGAATQMSYRPQPRSTWTRGTTMRRRVSAPSRAVLGYKAARSRRRFSSLVYSDARQRIQVRDAFRSRSYNPLCHLSLW